MGYARRGRGPGDGGCWWTRRGESFGTRGGHHIAVHARAAVVGDGEPCSDGPGASVAASPTATSNAGEASEALSAPPSVARCDGRGCLRAAAVRLLGGGAPVFSPVAKASCRARAAVRRHVGGVLLDVARPRCLDHRAALARSSAAPCARRVLLDPQPRRVEHDRQPRSRRPDAGEVRGRVQRLARWLRRGVRAHLCRTSVGRPGAS